MSNITNLDDFKAKKASPEVPTISTTVTVDGSGYTSPLQDGEKAKPVPFDTRTPTVRLFDRIANAYDSLEQRTKIVAGTLGVMAVTGMVAFGLIKTGVFTGSEDVPTVPVVSQEPQGGETTPVTYIAQPGDTPDKIGRIASAGNPDVAAAISESVTAQSGGDPGNVQIGRGYVVGERPANPEPQG